tara:strand:- start:173 stop:391 length:219 start_codon:yes stop_codon:yes gene_type:complete
MDTMLAHSFCGCLGRRDGGIENMFDGGEFINEEICGRAGTYAYDAFGVEFGLDVFQGSLGYRFLLFVLRRCL